MAGVIDIDFRPDHRKLRQFGFIALVGFGLLALLAWKEWAIFSFGLGSWRLPLVQIFGGLAGISLFFSLVFPRANLPLYVGLTIVALPIGFVLSYVIMGTIFYLIIAPIGIVMRLFGKDPMNRHFEPAAGTYWVDARPPRPAEDYFKQF